MSPRSFFIVSPWLRFLWDGIPVKLQLPGKSRLTSKLTLLLPDLCLASKMVRQNSQLRHLLFGSRDGDSEKNVFAGCLL